MFVAPPPDPEPASDAPPSLGLQRHSTVVIMARDEADRAVVGHKQGSSDGLFSPAINGRAVRGRESLIGASGEAHYHEHPNSTLLPHHNYDDEFSTDHIDYLTLRFKHLEQNAANQAATSALKSNKAAPAHSTAHPASRLIDKTLEGGFLADFFDRYHRRIIKAILTATVIWALYVVNDVQKNDQGLRKNFQETLIIRFVNCGIGVICAILLMTPFIQKRKLLMPVVGFAMITFGVAQIVFGLWDENELDPSYSVVMILIPSTSSTLFKQRFIFTVVFQAAILTLYIIITYAFDSFHSSSDLVLTALGLLFANCLFAMHAYRREYKMRKDYLMKCQLEREEIRSQNLLLRMLPGSVIAKLREGSEFIFYKHDEVTLLFAHINDWDTHVHAMTAMQVIRMLNSLFTRFDLLCDEHGVYKVETIGDVYLVSSGCPVEYTRDDHVDAIGAFALDMIAQAKLFMVEHVRDVKSGSVQVTDPKSKNYGLRKKHGTGHVSKLCPVQLRLGMNSGAIISGVVGVKYPRFRLMGDTINTASRMSTTALADQIQMSTRSWEKLNKSWFETKYRGEITVKGKGEMKTYLLLTKVNLICPLPRSLEQVQLANGTLSLEAFASNENLQSVGKTHGGLMVESPQAGKGSLGPRQSPSTHARPSPRQTQSSSNLSHLASPKAAAPGIIEMLPTQLPGVPEMLQKLRSGEVAEELDGESRSTSSMSGNLREREESTPSRLDPLDGDELGETAAEGEGAAVRDAKSEDDGTARSLPGKRALAMTPPPNEKRGLTVSTASPHAAPAGSPLRSARRGSHFGGTGSTHLLAKTGSAVSTNGRSTTINPSSSAGDNGRDISTSSRSKTKMVITAVDHQNTFKSVRLFSFGPMNAILKPSRRWWEVLSQNFTTDPVLEYEFRHVYGKEYRATNVWAVNFMWIFLLPLSMYDVLNNTELDSSLVAYSWIVRLFGLAVGVWFYRSSKKPEYVRYMQQMTTITVSVVSVVYIYTTSITSALLKSYGVSFVLVIMCLVCMFIGLRFYGALFSCLTIAIAWIIATVSFEDGLPGIGSVLLAGGVMYLETCWNMENDSRHDFVRFRKLYHEVRHAVGNRTRSRTLCAHF
jgi:class 3 adenylate cyclase